MTDSRSRAHAPKVSVVIPCYNAHPFLGRALDSVRAQTFRDLDILVVDDGSTDPKTLACLRTLGDDVRLIRQENRGLPGARNTGFRAARGEFVLPLDCDDWIAPTFLETAVTALEAAPDRAFAFAQIVLEGNETGVLDKTYNFFEQLFLNHVPYCICIRKDVWRQVGGYDETMRRGCEDWELNLRLGAAGHFGLAIAEPLFHYWVSPTGMLQSLSSNLHAELWSGIQAKHRQVYAPGSLVRAWTRWRRVRSNRYLPLYFGYYLAYLLLPKAVFMILFRRLLHLSRATRIRGIVASIA